jgi:diacylglycerol kinase (ATP)
MSNFTFTGRLRSVRFALRGIRTMLAKVVAKSKDVAAGAVLLSALGSVAVGLLIFLPHVLRWL